MSLMTGQSETERQRQGVVRSVLAESRENRFDKGLCEAVCKATQKELKLDRTLRPTLGQTARSQGALG